MVRRTSSLFLLEWGVPPAHWVKSKGRSWEVGVIADARVALLEKGVG